MSVSGRPPARLDSTAVLDRLDRQLSEVGRRQHRFAWLRDADSGDWIPVDGYYPGNRVVVIASEDAELLARCEELTSHNGLFPITLSERELSGDDAELAAVLRVRLLDRGWAPRAHGVEGTVVPPGTVALPGTEMGDDEFERPVDAPRREGGRAEPARSPRSPRAARSRGSDSERITVGFTLVVVVVIELVVGSGLIGLGAGDYVLGVGFLLDVGARALGVVVASQNDDLSGAWTTVLFGSMALWTQPDADRGDLAPAARITAIAAGCVGALGLLLAIF